MFGYLAPSDTGPAEAGDLKNYPDAHLLQLSWKRIGLEIALIVAIVITLWAAGDAAEAAAVKATIKKDVLTVTGTPGPDAITLRLRAGDPNTLDVDVSADGTADFSFDRRRFSAILVEGGAGNDVLVADHSAGIFTDTERTTLRGDDGNDTLLGSASGERLLGGIGEDFADGQQGADTIDLGDGADVFQWDPGDSSDTVVGGGGVDRLLFNGSGANENLAVSAATGGHARLTRDVAAIAMDLDDVEILDLRPFGGTDTLTVNGLAGTDVAEVRSDLAAFGGGDDGQVDSVVVPPGSIVGTDGGAAAVDGPGLRVRASNGAGTDRIHVSGTPVADVVRVAGTAGADTVSVVADGTDVAVVGATPGLYLRLSAVETLDVDLAGGDDSFSAVGNLAPLVGLDVDGGEGNDTVLGGNGADILAGGVGDDLVDGQQGADTVDLGDGADVFQWDPGDSSDTVVGGGGVDRLVFNGSGANENLAVSAATGGHARLTRDVAAIAMDLDDVEILDLRPFGGTDTLTVNGLAGTDVAEVRSDLAAFGGGDDGQIDSVVVNGTAGDDVVTVELESSQVAVRGLAAAVRIAGAAPAQDRLTVNGLEGNDTVTATPEAEAAIVVTLAP